MLLPLDKRKSWSLPLEWALDGLNDWLCRNRDHPTYDLESTPPSRARITALIDALNTGDVDSANAIVSQYRCVPVLKRWKLREDQPLDELCPEQLPAVLEYNVASGLTPFPHGEIEAGLGALALFQAGTLAFLRTCMTCGELYFPDRTKQQNCSTECSKKAYAKTPKERARRREAQRKKYQELFHPK